MINNLYNDFCIIMDNNLNESKFIGWKGDNDLTFVDKKTGDAEIRYKGKSYNYFYVCEMMGVSTEDMRKYATAQDVIEAINEIDKKSSVVNETRYDFSHIDPRTGLPREIKRPEDDIELMSRMPGRSCWITMLQNRVNLNSVGNNRYKKTVWFDRTDATVSSDRNKEDAVHFRSYILPGAGKPQGWIYADFRR